MLIYHGVVKTHNDKFFLNNCLQYYFAEVAVSTTTLFSNLAACACSQEMAVRDNIVESKPATCIRRQQNKIRSGNSANYFNRKSNK